MFRNVRFTVIVFATGLGIAACPEPEAVGHAPKAQVDMAKARLDKATDKMADSVQEAAKVGDTE